MDLTTWLRNQWDRVAGATAAFLGVITLVLGWVGVSGTGLTAEQIPYVISGGLGGLFLLGLGAALWLSADMRDEWRSIEALRQAVERTTAEADIDDHEASADEETSSFEDLGPITASATKNGQRSRAPRRLQA
jgi:hypothetical protein